MKQYDLTYKSPQGPPARADVWVFKPNTIFPGVQVVVYGQPNEYYEGLSVTNGCQDIVTALMRQYGVMPFQTLYVEHWPRREMVPVSYDAVYFTWRVVSPGCPVKIAATDPVWNPLHPTFELVKRIHEAIYGVLLTSL